MEISTLLADPDAILLEKIVPDHSSLTLVIRVKKRPSPCPRCHRPSARVHSYYTRQVADLPWQGVGVRLKIRTRRLRCKNSLCTKRIFCERLPKVVDYYARRTVRMNDALRLIDYLLGGEAGSRATHGLAMKTSADTLLRRVRMAATAPDDVTKARVVGVDDFAFRKGQRYGSIIVDLERHRVIDLLPDREAASLTAWLKARPGVEVISRDRSPAYAIGIDMGAPQAVQVADRFHLLKNMREVLERVMLRLNRFLRSQTLSAPASAQPTAANDGYVGCRVRLQPHLERTKRARHSHIKSGRQRLPSAEQASWMLLYPEKQADEDKHIVELICRLSPEVKKARELAKRFVALIKERADGDLLRARIIDALSSEISELRSFAKGLMDDYRAVHAALEYQWSQGQVEGQVHRLKMIKRTMYGRAKLDLLRARVLHLA